MKTNKVVKTSNLAQLVSVADRLTKVEAGVPGMGLVHGQRGLGKTTAAIWYAAQKANNTVYVRAKGDWSYSWMMEELLIEFGATPRRGDKAKYDDLINALLEKPRLIILDEANQVSPKLIETLRTINDMTHNPIMFIGHEGVVDKFRRQGPFFDRLLYIAEVKPITIDDLGRFAEECMEIGVDREALGKVLKLADGNFRRAVVKLKGFEDRAKGTLAKAITAEMVKE
ncbi:MAG: ATP-binding protein [Deltaproteobacteria bacterium]|jgi:DNA transposition AAA+ family ATPase|nr:ATP-binding protein [Deltaproteobacteria bacterium]